jgi:NAD(P)-dependent dehydrogenase (short-subunit alcohol dehydrogenase family)
MLITISLAGLLPGCCSTSELSKSGQRKTAGKTFVIIGASSGFGKGVALQLGQYHANVVLAARRTELLEAVAKQLTAAGGTALVVTTDINKPEDVAKLAAAAVAKYGHIDVWINDVGVGAIGRFWEIPLADHARLIDVNLTGIINGSYTAPGYLLNSDQERSSTWARSTAKCRWLTRAPTPLPKRRSQPRRIPQSGTSPGALRQHQSGYHRTMGRGFTLVGPCGEL